MTQYEPYTLLYLHRVPPHLPYEYTKGIYQYVRDLEHNTVEVKQVFDERYCAIPADQVQSYQIAANLLQPFTPDLAQALEIDLDIQKMYLRGILGGYALEYRIGDEALRILWKNEKPFMQYRRIVKFVYTPEHITLYTPELATCQIPLTHFGQGYVYDDFSIDTNGQFWVKGEQHPVLPLLTKGKNIDVMTLSPLPKELWEPQPDIVFDPNDPELIAAIKKSVDK
jgi:hypothetical protein